MTKALTIFALLLLVGCSASAGPLTDAEIRSSVLAALAEIDAGIEREDPFLASNPAADLFRMNNNIALRYTGGEFSNSGPAALRNLFSSAFDLHANILHEITLLDLTISGEVATAATEVEFNSLRVDRVPPENFTSTSRDTLVFVLERGNWKVLNWDETPAVEEPEEAET
jgi:hypothetical protein